MDVFPLISVIVPVYNVEEYLERCLNSIIGQTYINLEIILVNDGSTDTSLSICKKYREADKRVVIIDKTNGGLSSARNAGLNICKGEYIGFVDSDDYLELDMYERLFSRLRHNGNCISMVGTSIENNCGNVVRQKLFDGKSCSRKTFLKSLLLHTGDESVCTKLFRRDIIKDVRFDETKLNEDLLFMYEVQKKIESISLVEGVGYHYCVRSGSISRSFGKAVHDMVLNALFIRSSIDMDYPEYSAEAEQFSIFQCIAFFCCCPFPYNSKNDKEYSIALNHLRENYFHGIKNRYLSKKSKIILTLIMISPKLCSALFKIRHRKRK